MPRESIYWRRPLTYGHPYKSVCWLIRPTSYDYDMPEDHTLMFEFLDPQPVHPSLNFATHVIFRTIAWGEARHFAKECYRIGTPFVFRTAWVDPDGIYVKKTVTTKAAKETKEIIEKLMII